MFNITIDLFLPGGGLRAVLEQFALALLRHNSNLKTVLGTTNYISGLLAKAARKANISDTRFPPDPTLPRLCPEMLIVEWGNIIEDDYRRRVDIACREAEGKLDTAVAPLQASMARQEAVLEKLLANQNRILNENCSLRAEVQVLHNRHNDLSRDLALANAKLAVIEHGSNKLSSFIKTPDKPISNQQIPPTSVQMEDTLALNDELNMEAISDTTAPLTVNAREKTTVEQSSSITITKSEPTSTLAPWNHEAEEISKTKKKDSNIKVDDFLMNLREMGCINQLHISKSTIPDIICQPGNKCYFRYCLEFIEFVATSNKEVPNFIAQIADKTISETMATTAAVSIASVCLAKIKELDDKSVRKRSVLALGSRVRDYKKRIAEANKLTHKDQKFSAESVELVELNELKRRIAEGTGTPPGNKSITTYTTTIARKK